MVIASGAGAASRKAIGISTFYGMILATVVASCSFRRCTPCSSATVNG